MNKLFAFCIGFLITFLLTGCLCPCMKKPQNNEKETSNSEEIELIEQDQ